MSRDLTREPMLEMFIFETLQLIEQLEQEVIHSEKASCFAASSINEIFRIMHTIKGSAAMMLFNNLASLAHSIEDLFYFLRENNLRRIDFSSLSDIVLEGVDFIKNEIGKLECGKDADGDSAGLISGIKEYLSTLKAADGLLPAAPCINAGDSAKEQKFYISSQKVSAGESKHFYKAVLFFDDDCGMENIRAFSVIHDLKDFAEDIAHTPADIVDDSESAEIIKSSGFGIKFGTLRAYEEMKDFFWKIVLVKEVELEEIVAEEEIRQMTVKKSIVLDMPCTEEAARPQEREREKDGAGAAVKQSIISVSLSKLDKLMDLVGELVISEAMVTQNPDISGLQLESFNKAARQLKKITGELQDIVMSIRMVPLSSTFQKMNRIVRDMNKKLKKEVTLEILGQETEVDKNIIEHISDPLMHLIRNCMDHGLEPPEERLRKGKSEAGRITLEARNAGGEVWILVKDDGRGLDRNKILQKAKENGWVHKPESELSDREIYSIILLPGFSTKDRVTEFSGRGVGMDVVTSNIEKVGGTVLIDSAPGTGTVISMKIPLTLAIINGMTVRVGNARFTVPTTSIRESFRVGKENIIVDPEGNEVIMVRGECYPVLRLHRLYNIGTGTSRLNEGITMMVEKDASCVCLFADELLGEQQVVVKALPAYLRKVPGIAGCTLLGDGGISLIIDGSGLMHA